MTQVNTTAAAAPRTSNMFRVALASCIGTAIEYYDYLAFGIAAALIFNQLFFPAQDPLTGTLLAFAAFGTGFIVRPLGGIIIGHFGDRIGRKRMLVLTLVLMGGATFLIGCLPTYEQIGIWAPIALVLLRLIQGFSAGGEWAGAVLMAVEHAPPNRRGFYGSWAMLGIGLGSLLALLAFAALGGLDPQAFRDWGWRVPFLISAILIPVGLYIRLRIAESPSFDELRKRNAVLRVPILDAIRNYPKAILLTAGTNLGYNTFIYLVFTFTLTYATQQLKLPRSLILNASMAGAVLQMLSVLLFAAISDKVGRKPVLMVGAVAIAAYAFIFFRILDIGTPTAVYVAICMAYVVSAIMFGPIGAFFCEHFGTQVRYSGASLGYQLGAVLGGGLAPTLAVALYSMSNNQTWSVSLYVAIVAAISLVCLMLLRETAHEEQK
ncbi:metabolite-proton symporter [Beijerinckia sp. 28-YEA-48]|nr:metabolite-proton symporter [Beijerinckia sp. 28-YEA-48]